MVIISVSSPPVKGKAKMKALAAVFCCAAVLCVGIFRYGEAMAEERFGNIISQEFDRVLMVLDRRFYYDESLRLCADGLRADGTCADGLRADGLCGEGMRADGLCAEGMRADGMCADGTCADVMCAEGTKGAAIPLLYEGLSRAREKLCLIVVENRELFSQILAIRTMNQC